MKGVILAGGTGSRLQPLTKVTNKHLLPVYNKPMIYYPLKTFANAGIKEILIISGKDYAGHFLNLLGSGSEFGVNLSYEVQEDALGIADALKLAKVFSEKQNLAVILGDNIFEDNISKDVKDFKDVKKGAKVFLKKVDDAKRFGVAELSGNKIIGIEEKPKDPKTKLAVTGLYMYDKNVFEIIENLKPSKRGEYEITDVNNEYIKKGDMGYSILSGSWTDAGTFESLFRANKLAKENYEKNLNR